MEKIIEINDSDFSGIINAACTALKDAATSKTAVERSVTAVATAVTNRLLSGHNLDRLNAAIAAFKAYPQGYAMFKNLISLYVGGFYHEKGKYIDSRGTPDQVKLIRIEPRTQDALWIHDPKSKAGKALIAIAYKQWQAISTKTQGLVFSKPKRERLIKYTDIVKYLCKVRDSEKNWNPLERREIATLLKKLEAELL